MSSFALFLTILFLQYLLPVCLFLYFFPTVYSETLLFYPHSYTTITAATTTITTTISDTTTTAAASTIAAISNTATTCLFIFSPPATISCNMPVFR